MTKTNVAEKQVAEMMPDELGALKQLVQDFMSRMGSIDNEIDQLKDDRKELIEEFAEKLDMKTLQLALKVLKIQRSVQHQDAYDLFITALTDQAR